MQLAYVCIVTICTHTKQKQAARILYTRVQFVHILHMCTLHVCCVERNICAAHILRLSIFVRVCNDGGPVSLTCAIILLCNDDGLVTLRHSPFIMYVFMSAGDCKVLFAMLELSTSVLNDKT